MSASFRLTPGPRPRTIRSKALHLTAIWLAAVSGFAACSDDSETSNTAPPEPPRLRVERLRTSDGNTFEPGDTVALPCDRVLGIEVGPTTATGILENWTLRPPDACGSLEACGYVVARLDPSGDDEVAFASSSAITIPLRLRGVDLDGAHVLRVELHQGNDGVPYEVDDMPVADEIALTFDLLSCDAGMGAAGGMGGQGGGGGQITAGSAGMAGEAGAGGAS